MKYFVPIDIPTKSEKPISLTNTGIGVFIYANILGDQ